ncbi:DUF4231 domain-containing protein [Streptomyces sp. NPDC127036]|uniref:DUF4231 domain-containing protein n=1 Tax=Streptomyces sp. NPDC127036 TaxID=3347112 RepID=UPI0036573B6A
MEPERGLRSSDLPGIFHAADLLSLGGQKAYLRHTRFRLWCMILAAVSASFSAAKFMPESSRSFLIATSLLLFISALTAEISLLIAKPEDTWYRGRAVAESAKTLAWKFSMRAAPFHSAPHVESAERTLLEHLRRLCSEAPSSLGAHLTESTQITESMRQLRSSSSMIRRKAYLNGRIKEQRKWYQQRAARNLKASRRWRVFLLMLESLGAAGCVLLLVKPSSFDMGGFIAAGVASGGAWIEVKQFDTLASAYSLTSSELSLIANDGELVTTDDEFLAYVISAEHAISREHTMWLARRSI